MDRLIFQRISDLEDSLPDLEFPEFIRAYDARAGPDCVDKEKAEHEHEPKTNSEVNNDGMEKTIPTTHTAATKDSATIPAANALDRRCRND